ncbi:hypothetical protein FHW88_004897 [Mucilaginibacter sp. SG538B]|uniref:hypothetical protein n=1 Tax=Mucilaginibacter sp. SG538B TaxID=2587021 RepID=UPI00159E5744|nr:hypothetical protein [Mucilaginibacter sp. SG538B]NVM66579.1 hypothetical protein [Mucilaginibacter sp. SG538B]
MANPTLGVLTRGPNEELLIAGRLIKAGRPLVLDILAITTLSSLGALDDLNKLLNPKIVTRFSRGELYDQIKEQERSSQSGTFSFGYEDGRYAALPEY